MGAEARGNPNFGIIHLFFRGGESLSRLALKNAAKQSSIEKVRCFKYDDTEAEVSAHARAPLSVFRTGQI